MQPPRQCFLARLIERSHNTSVCGAVVTGRVRMVHKLMAELRGLIGKTPAPPPAQPLYSRKDLKANLHRHMSIVLDSASGTSAVAIDNKIEQAMDLYADRVAVTCSAAILNRTCSRADHQSPSRTRRRCSISRHSQCPHTQYNFSLRRLTTHIKSS